MSGTGSNGNRGNLTLHSEASSFLQWVPTDLISLGSQKYNRIGEVRRVFGISSDGSSENRAAIAKEELKHFREGLQDASKRARDRVNFFQRYLLKLEKCKETMITKKRQRCDLSTSESSDAVKLGNRVQRKPLNEKEKASGQYKGSRVDVDGKCGPSSNRQFVEEKSVGAKSKLDSRESKSKTKCSVGVVGNRSFNVDELKIRGSSLTKLSTDAKFKACDAPALRKSKATSGTNAASRVDCLLESTISNINSAMMRNDPKSFLVGRKIGLNAGSKAKFVKKPIDAKGSRATRTSSTMLVDSCPKNNLSSSSQQDSSELPATNITQKKRNSTMAQWGGQRPHKKSRMRRSFFGVNCTGPTCGVTESEESSAKMNVKDDGEKPGSQTLALGKVTTCKNESSDDVLKGKISKETACRPSDVLNESKSCRLPSKTLKDRKTSRVCTPLNSEPLNSLGESDDDREELMNAVKAAQTFKSRLCSSPFWKGVEPFFRSICSQDITFLKHQLSLSEELQSCIYEALPTDYKTEPSLGNQVAMKSGTIQPRASLYQRVLSAIIDEQPEAFNSESDSHSSCTLLELVTTRIEDESNLSCRPSNRLTVDRISSNKSVSSKESSISSLCSNGYWLGESEICSNYADQSKDATSEKQYHLLTVDDKVLLELQSIGLAPEPLPDLSESEGINQEIIELREHFSQKFGSKKNTLDKLCSVLTPVIDDEKREIEQVAMDHLVEIAYNNILAMRGKSSSKSSARKVAKRTALSFLKRTLSRCKKYENSRMSPFSEFMDLLVCSHIESNSSGPTCSLYKRREGLTDDVAASDSSRVTSKEDNKINNVGNEDCPFDNLCSMIKEEDEPIDVDFFSNIDDDDGLNTVGLEIPMDDLSDLHFVF